MALPQLLPLPEAASELGLSEAELRTRIEAGTIAAGKLPSGEIVVSKENIIAGEASDINDRLRAIKREDFEHLRGQPITVTEAAEKYGIADSTIRDWLKIKYVNVINPGDYPMKLDEADLAYCAAIQIVRKKIGVRYGAPLLSNNGNPYLLKHPNLSRYRRKRR